VHFPLSCTRTVTTDRKRYRQNTRRARKSLNTKFPGNRSNDLRAHKEQTNKTVVVSSATAWIDLNEYNSPSNVSINHRLDYLNMLYKYDVNLFSRLNKIDLNK